MKTEKIITTILLIALAACAPGTTTQEVSSATPVPTTPPLETLPAAERLSDFPVAWVRQVGTGLTDEIGGIVADNSGFVYISCLCSLGAPQALDNAFFPSGSTFTGRAATVLKFDLQGHLAWQRQIDSGLVNASDPVVAVDDDGNVILLASGYLDNVSYAFMSKYDADGNEIWVKTLLDHTLADIVTDAEGNIFVGGRAQFDPESNVTTFVRKYTPEGEEAWTSLLDPEGAFVNGLTLHVIVGADENINVIGSISGAFAGFQNLGGDDVFIQNYSPQGQENWIQQFGTSDDDYIQDADLDSDGNLYLSFESVQPVVAKYDASGAQLWIKQLDRPGTGWIQLATDQEKNVYVLLNHNWPDVSADAEVQKLDQTGTPVWSLAFPSSWEALPCFLANDQKGNLFLTGETVGSLLGQVDSGNYDVFVLMFIP